MNRWTAGATHLGISLGVAALVYTAVRLLWYPGPLFEIAGGLDLLLIVISVHVILGPFITLLIFRPGKWGLAFDLWFIGTLQVAALCYGVYAIAESRPVYVMFVKDRFELVRAGEIDDADLEQAAPGFGSLPWFGYRLAGARPPKDPKEQMKHMDLALAGGKDLHYFPKLYVPYSAVTAEAARAAAPLARLRSLNPGGNAEVDALVRSGTAEEQLGFLPMRAGERDLTVVVRRPSGEVTALLPLRPWEF